MSFSLQHAIQNSQVRSSSNVMQSISFASKKAERCLTLPQYCSLKPSTNISLKEKVYANLLISQKQVSNISTVLTKLKSLKYSFMNKKESWINLTFTIMLKLTFIKHQNIEKDAGETS